MHPMIGTVQDRRMEAGIQRVVQEKLDEFLDVYSLYLQTRIAWIHDEVRLKAYELSLLDSRFNPRC